MGRQQALVIFGSLHADFSVTPRSSPLKLLEGVQTMSLTHQITSAVTTMTSQGKMGDARSHVLFMFC